jgi:hypothetical protein
MKIKTRQSIKMAFPVIGVLYGFVCRHLGVNVIGFLIGLSVYVIIIIFIFNHWNRNKDAPFGNHRT